MTCIHVVTCEACHTLVEAKTHFFFFIQSDPMAVVYAKKIDGKLEELGRTEVVLNSLHPKWIEKVTVAFQFEIVQPLV
jgi:hypothetical protein